MASVTKRPNGHRWVQFKGLDGKRKTIRLGAISDTQAHDVRRNVEGLLAARMTGLPIPRTVAAWASSLPTKLYDRIASTGLLDERPDGRLSTLVAYCKAQQTGKPSTLQKYENAAENLLGFFEGDRDITTITPGDAEEYRLHLLTSGGRQREGQGLAPTTAQKRLNLARRFFERARKKGWLHVNPFEDVAITNAPMIEREFFVDRDLTYRLLDSCRDSQFKLLLAMVRFGGLRCPSEVLIFRWSWINWESDSMTIHSPKTEYIAGKATRVAPLFAELRPYIEAAFSELPEKAPDLMFPALANVTGSALTGRLRRLCRKNGVELWPKPWVNLRGTRETELVDAFPIKSACQWIGNSEAVAKRHYLQVTKEHHARAVASGAGATRPPKGEVKRRSTKGSLKQPLSDPECHSE